MKDNAFEMGRNQGYTANEIRAQWGKIKADAGAEPTPAMLAAYDADALLAIGVARPLAKAWGGLFVPSGTPKGRKFKPEKARTYTAAEIVGFIVADPTAEGLRAEYMRRTGGAPALLYVNGKLAEAETADRIQRLFERDPVAPFVVIDGAEVTPVGYPEPDAKQDAEDPYQRGAALGQPGDISARLGVSLAAIPHDTMQAIACAVENDLADASVRDLQRDAEAAKGKSPAEYLADKPLARRAWPTWKKPSLMLARAPRNPPPAGGDVAVSVGRTPPVGPARLDLNTIHRALVDSGLTSSRDALLAGIPRAFVSSLTTVPSAAAQALIDLGALQNAGTLRDGSRPLVTYLQAAVALAGPRREAQVFRDALRALENSSPAWLFREWRS